MINAENIRFSTEQREHLNVAFNESIKVVGDAMASLGNAAREAGEALGEYGKYIYSISMDAYADAGHPYGKTRRGFKKWQNEQLILWASNVDLH